MRIPIFLLSYMIVFASCADLDSNLFSPKSDIEEYMLNGFEGEQEIVLPDGEYIISDSLIHKVGIQYIDDKGQNSTLSAVYIGDTSRIGKDSVILYLHGNSGNIDFYWNRARLLAHVGGKHRVGILMIDYPGYGLSEGDPSIDNLIRAADGSGEWLKDRGIQDGELILYGFSLGSIPTLQSESLLKRPSNENAYSQKIILEAPIGSIQTMVEDASGSSFDASFFTSYYDNSNIRAVKSIEQPLLLLHGEEDGFLSLQTHGIPLSEAYQGSSLTFLKVKNADHGDLPEIMGYEAYLSELTKFIFE